MEADLATPALAFLHGCSFAASPGLQRRTMLPAAALLELAAEAAHILGDSPAAQQALLLSAVLSASTALPDVADIAGSRLLCAVDARVGSVSIFSGSRTVLACECSSNVPLAAASAPTRASQRLVLRSLLAVRAGHAPQPAAVACLSHVTAGFLADPAATEAATLLQAATAANKRGLCSAAASCAAFLVPAALAPARQGILVSSSSSSSSSAGRRRQVLDVGCTSPAATGLAAACYGLVMMQRAASPADAQLPQGSPALQLLWQPVAACAPVQAPALPPQRWLIMSAQPCSLRQLCSAVDAPVTALNLVFSSGGPADSAAGGRAELTASCEAELALILSRTAAPDHIFLVQDPGMRSAQQGVGSVALLWAFGAFQRSSLRARLSLVTWGTQAVGPYSAAAEPASHMATGAATLGPCGSRAQD